MGKLWPPLVGVLALFMGGLEAPANWPGGTGSWALAAACLLLLAVFGLLSLSSGFLQTSVVRFAFLLRRDWERANRLYFTIMRPGVLAHELAHAGAAMLVGGKVTSFNALETKVVNTGRGGSQIRLGHVGYTVPGRGNRLGWRLKDAFVGFAPLLLGVGLITLLLLLSGVDWALGVLPALQAAAGDWRAWVVMLAIVEVADNMIPSKADRKNWPATLIVLAVLAVLLLLVLNLAAGRGLLDLPDWLGGLAAATTFLALVLVLPVALNLLLGGVMRALLLVFGRGKV